jgi:glycosyltransferase involved in cell wall biosynthesis
LEIGPLLENQWTGIPVFTRRLAQSLLRSGRVDLSFCFNLAEIPAPNVLAAIRHGTGSFLRQQFEEHAHEMTRMVDVSCPILYPSVKTAIGACASEASTIHDISTLVMPENHEDANVAYHTDNLPRELASDDMVFCVSEATKSALETYFPSVLGKTSVLYQYADWPEAFPLMERNLPRIDIGRYAVVIGTIEPRKNLGVIMRALTLPEVEQSDLKFVVIGRVGWLVDQLLEEMTPLQRQRLIFAGFVSEFSKYRLIAGAEFMVYPSLYEGFGIPAVEALSLGKPVLAARTSSFPEVIGRAGLYFDPLSAGDFAAALAEMESPAKLRELSALAEPQSRQFGWQLMAQPVLEWLDKC